MHTNEGRLFQTLGAEHENRRAAMFVDKTVDSRSDVDGSFGHVASCDLNGDNAVINNNRTVLSVKERTLNERIEYKLLSLTYKVLTTSQPDYLHNLISVQYTG